MTLSFDYGLGRDALRPVDELLKLARVSKQSCSHYNGCLNEYSILVGSQRAGERVLASVTRFVERKLKLKVNDTKSRVVKTSQCKFLGFSFHGSTLVWHEKSLAQFKYRVRKLTGRSRGVSMDIKIRELTQYLRGWINYFGIAAGYQKCIDLDQWIRRRLRMCFWTKWPGAI